MKKIKYWLVLLAFILGISTLILILQSIYLSNLPIDFANITFEDYTCEYDGQIHSLKINGELPEGTSVVYQNNDQVNAGTYDVKSTITCEGYNTLELLAKLTITKKPISEIEFLDETYTYDGQIRSLNIVGDLPEGVTVSYDNNDQEDAGIYEVIAHFEDSTGNYKVPEDMTATLTINKADFDMSKVTFKNQTITYDGNEHELAIEGELPSGVVVSYDNNKLTNVGRVNAVAKFTHNNSNYNVINSFMATLTIVASDIKGISFSDGIYTYDGLTHSLLIDGELPIGVNVTYQNNNQINAGIYEVIAHFEDSTGNYKVPEDMTSILTINKADFDMSGITFNDQEFIYDGNSQSLSISGTSLPSGVTVSYQNNNQINAGIYEVIAKFAHANLNYNAIPDMKATLKINQKKINGITFIDDEVTFDKQPHSLKINGTLPSGIIVSYSQEDLVNVGEYTIVAHFEDTNEFKNYILPSDLSATLKIIQKEIILDNTYFVNKVETYDGTSKIITIAKDLPEGVSVDYYTNNERILAGIQTATVTFKYDSNYTGDIITLKADLIINRANFDMSKVIFNGKEVVYNDSKHSLTIEGDLPSGVTVSYENNDQTKAGTYEVIAKFSHTNSNYNAISDMKATLNIKQKEIVGVTFEDKTFEYDSFTHSIEISGTPLPSGVNVIYTNNNQSSANIYTVVAHFEDTTGNYKVPNDMSAKMTIHGIDYNMEGVIFNDDTVTYNDKVHSLAISGATLPSGVTVSYENNDQTNAGTYEVIAKFSHTNPNYNAIPDMKATLTINQKEIIGVKLNGDEVTYDGQPHSLNISGTKLPKGVNVTYSEEKVINAKTYHITAHFEDTTGNYKVPNDLTANLIINKKEVSIDNSYFVDKTVVYNENEQVLELTKELPEGIIDVIYDNNKLTNVGFVNATVTFVYDDNHTGPNKFAAKLEITQADYDISKVIFEDTNILYDGKVHELVISGTPLPNWITVTYKNNKITEKGTLKAEAIFTHENGNYKPIPSKTANLTIDRPTYKVTFRQVKDGVIITKDIVKEVLYLADLTIEDIPEVTPVPEFIVEWENKDLTKVKGDIVVNALYQSVHFKVNYYINGIKVQEQNTIYKTNFTPIIYKIDEGLEVNKWTYNGKIFETTQEYLYDYRVNINLENNGTVDLISSSSSGYDLEFDEPTKTAKIKKYNGGSKNIVIPRYAFKAGKIYKINNIKDGAFKGNKTLETVTIPDEISDLGLNAFEKCENLRKVTLPSTLTEISDAMFLDCMKLEDVAIPNGVEKIGKESFLRCKSLKKIDIPASVTIIGDNAFLDCDGLTTMVIPDTVLTIGINIFGSCSNLTSVKLPSHLTSIPESTFSYCTELVDFEFPAALERIETNAFSYCVSLKGLNLPLTVNYIGENAFDTCTSLATINLPEGIEILESGVFTNCSSLTKIIIPTSVTNISRNAFSYCINLKDVNIHDKVTHIGESAFEECTALTSVVIPNSVAIMDANAFKGCTSLTNVTLSNKLTYLNKYTFSGCSSLLHIVVPDNIVTMAEGVFSGCSSLLSVVLPNNMIEIPNKAFENCTSLINIKLPDQASKIGESAFKGCSDLNELVLPKLITNISRFAFQDCTGLTNVLVPLGVEMMGNDVFKNCPYLTIYCEHASQPKSWNPRWNPDKRPIKWGYKIDNPEGPEL